MPHRLDLLTFGISGVFIANQRMIASPETHWAHYFGKLESSAPNWPSLFCHPGFWDTGSLPAEPRKLQFH
jgi:hypothetical protein